MDAASSGSFCKMYAHNLPLSLNTPFPSVVPSAYPAKAAGKSLFGIILELDIFTLGSAPVTNNSNDGCQPNQVAKEPNKGKWATEGESELEPDRSRANMTIRLVTLLSRTNGESLTIGES